MSRHWDRRFVWTALAAAAFGWTSVATGQTTVTIGIGTQDTTTNTVGTGTVVRELKLLERYLPKNGKYANINSRSNGRTSRPVRPSPTA